jgi:hypothetical protein
MPLEEARAAEKLLNEPLPENMVELLAQLDDTEE